MHAKLDTPRARFFWEGAGVKKKYHLVKWAAVCRPKELGGLGILNSKLMNVALLGKWWWRLAQDESGLWASLLKAKYFPNGNPFSASANGSSFWRGLQAVRPAFDLGAKFLVSNGQSTRFWLDHWLGDSPLWQSHPTLYRLATDTNILVGEALRTVPPAIHFMRPLLIAERASWNELNQLIGVNRLGTTRDTVEWSLTASKKFSCKSLYYKLTEGPVLVIAMELWKASLPLKIKIFMWQMLRNRLPTSDNVAKRNGPADGTCGLCGLVEDANHVFFRCHLARFAWSAVREAFHSDWNPASGHQLVSLLKSTKGTSSRIAWRCVGALLWSIWTTRNKFTIEKKFLRHPADVIFKCHLFLQMWTPLGKERDAERMTAAMASIKEIQAKARQAPAS